VELEGLNHMFQRSETGLPSDYGILETTIEPEVLSLLADWIVETVRGTETSNRATGGAPTRATGTSAGAVGPPLPAGAGR